MRHLLYPELLNRQASAGLLPLRLMVGVAFLFHGLPKIQHPTDWMGSAAPVPGILQVCAAVAEFGGGIALILGFLTRLAGLGLIVNMLTALAIVHLPHGDPFVGKPGQHSAEPAVLYLATSVLFFVIGPGLYSLDAVLFGEKSETAGEAVRRERIPSVWPPAGPIGVG